MQTVVFVDTSVLCEILAVPGKSQRVDAIKTELAERVRDGERLILPAAAIIETGNHIAQLSDGHSRRDRAEAFVRLLSSVTGPTPPWVLYDATWDGALVTAICEGPRGAPALPELSLRHQAEFSGSACTGRAARSTSRRLSATRQKSSPNGVRWMDRRTSLAKRTDFIASSTSGCASTTW